MLEIQIRRFGSALIFLPILLAVIAALPQTGWASSVVEDDFSSESTLWGTPHPTWGVGNFIVRNGFLNFITGGVPSEHLDGAEQDWRGSTLSASDSWIVQVDASESETLWRRSALN